jgi:hypothetical protein
MPFVNQFESKLSGRYAAKSNRVPGLMTDRLNTADEDIGQLPTTIAPGDRRLTAAEYRRLGDVPPEAEWFANIKNKSTRRAYENAIRDFIRFTGIGQPEEFRTVTRAHVIAWPEVTKRSDLTYKRTNHELRPPYVVDRSADPVREKCPHTLRRSDRRDSRDAPDGGTRHDGGVRCCRLESHPVLVHLWNARQQHSR